MKFYGEPDELVNSRIKNRMAGTFTTKPIFRFDNNGEYETEDETLIERLKPHYKYDEKIETFKCKKCEFETNNKGLLLAHYRTHKKEV